MKIRLKQPWSDYGVGTILEPADHIADHLVTTGIAERLTIDTEGGCSTPEIERTDPENAMATPQSETAVGPRSRRRRVKKNRGEK